MDKYCYCYTCDKWLHYLDINRHREMHKDKKEDCTIAYGYGHKVSFKFSDKGRENGNDE